MQPTMIDGDASILVWAESVAVDILAPGAVDRIPAPGLPQPSAAIGEMALDEVLTCEVLAVPTWAQSTATFSQVVELERDVASVVQVPRGANELLAQSSASIGALTWTVGDAAQLPDVFELAQFTPTTTEPVRVPRCTHINIAPGDPRTVVLTWKLAR
jgi:hypothetical protein